MAVWSCASFAGCTTAPESSPPSETAAMPTTGDGFRQADWGIGAVLRVAEIPFAATDDSVSSFVPVMYYEGEDFFLRGISAGMHLWKEAGDELNLFARGRFVDIPAEIQNEVQGDTVDFGIQVHRELKPLWLEAEALTDDDGSWHLTARLGSHWSDEDLELIPSLNFGFLSSRFNEQYYALSPVTGDAAGSGWQIAPDLTARYHLFSDLYLLGGARYTFNNSGIAGLPSVDASGQYEFHLGFGIFQHPGDRQFMGQPYTRLRAGRELSTPAYVRTAFGQATPSELGDILAAAAERDEYENTMASVFYGVPLTDDCFGLPLAIYMTPGFVWHHSSAVQSSTQEYVLAIKSYYTVPWPLRWRAGLAEGLSWIEGVTYIERTDVQESGYRPSQLMNYLDLSLDLNVGDLVGVDWLEPLWFGYSIHHRSSIFESASQFGRIQGGSNYQTAYLQWDLL